MNQPPVRLCCGQRHWGAMCPDGKVMCCLCFNRYSVDQLDEEDGQPIDVCKLCAAKEAGQTKPWCACPANLCADDTDKVRCRGN